MQAPACTFYCYFLVIFSLFIFSRFNGGMNALVDTQLMCGLVSLTPRSWQRFQSKYSLLYFMLNSCYWDAGKEALSMRQ